MVSFFRYFTVCITYQPPLVHSHGATGFHKLLEADISKVHLHNTVLKSVHIVASYIYMKNVLRIN